MGSSIFITGASGFIGQQVMNQFEAFGFERVICLVRRPREFQYPSSMNGRMQIVAGGIEDKECYAPYLVDVDSILHIAATTGKARRDEYFRVNTLGTELLLDQARQSGVKNILFLSTISVKFPDKTYYYYAQSKELGEKAVINSGLNYIIIRPTIVIGEGAPIWNSLSTLAKGRFLPLLGSENAMIQPIYLDDLAQEIGRIIKGNHYDNKILEMGGPQQISFEEFLIKIHFAYGEKPPYIIRIPLNQLQRILGSFEKWLHPVLPISAGQLSAFLYDGTTETTKMLLHEEPTLHNVDEMIELVINQEKAKATSLRLNNECNVFTKHLVGSLPTDYVTQKYLEAHRASDIFNLQSADLFDRILLDISIKHPVFTKMADTYSRYFAKSSTLRKKLILVMAILENSAPGYRKFDLMKDSSFIMTFLQLFYIGSLFSISLFFSILFFSLIRLFTRARKGG